MALNGKPTIMAIRKGSEYNNINETWKQNEQHNPPRDREHSRPEGVSRHLQKTIQEEAAAYDNANREERWPDAGPASPKDGETGSETGDA